MPSTLTDADIDRHDAAGAGAPQTLSDADIEAHDRGTPAEPSGYGHELFRQLISDPIKALKSNPLGALTSALGSAFSVINPGFDPVPGKGGHITLTEPTQGEAVQDIVNRGPGAVGAAATIGGLGLAAPFVGRNIGTIGTATGGALKGAGKAVIEPATFRGLKVAVPGGNVMAGAVGGGAAARALGLPSEAGAIVGGAAPIVKGAISGAKQALANRAAGAQTAAAIPNVRNLLIAAQKAPTPESVLPESVASDLTRPSEITPPPEAAAQLNTQAAPAPAAKPAPVPIATRMANAARAARPGNAETLAQALETEGMAEVGQTMPVFKLGDFARLHKLYWPTDQQARLSLMDATRTALRQRTTKP